MARLLALMTALIVTGTGCNQSHSGSVEASALEIQFKSAAASLKTMADKAAAAMKTGDLAAALAELQGLVPSKDKLTTEQAQAVQQAIAHVQSQLAAAAAKAAEEAAKKSPNVPKPK